MDLRSVFAPSCTLSIHKSFLQGVEFQPCLHHGAGFKRVLTKCCHRRICGGLQAEVVEDSTLIDIQESSDGYVLFKFGTTQLYEDPPRFISSVAQPKSVTHIEAGREVIDCSAVVYRLPNENENSFIGPYHWGYQASSLLDTPSSTSSSTTSSYENRAELPSLTFSSEVPDVPLDFIGPRSFADYLVSAEARNESFARFVRSSGFTASMVKLLPANISFEDVSSKSTSLGPEAVHSMKSSTVKRVSREGKKTRARHKRPSRDLYRSSSFQMYELIFCYPFMDPSKAASTWKAIPKEKYTELFGALNQLAVGLAGSGLALVLFVASRMLCLNATLDCIKLMSLLRGVGLLWLSSALQRFGSAVKLMGECGEKARSERKEHLAMLRKEVHAVTFKPEALPPDPSCENGLLTISCHVGDCMVIGRGQELSEHALQPFLAVKRQGKGPTIVAYNSACNKCSRDKWQLIIA
ncbi:hypothetical protein GOP47_0005885 [Adiantum capillus-veneris]|uniref:Uncharacterized protein n=1 Tax=Adiantum capillus-veneris TaxID=13818 RepID=A0A9D4V275_ADICA|nr:hypothetical protein GOP47_0005885 [Adiantum capillus-veneris]